LGKSKEERGIGRGTEWGLNRRGAETQREKRNRNKKIGKKSGELCNYTAEIVNGWSYLLLAFCN